MTQEKTIRTIAEYAVVKKLITETYPTGIVSIVADSFDLWILITQILPRLKDEIMARDGKLVIRPDSGDPADILCGIKNLRKSYDGLYYRAEDMINDGLPGDLHRPGSKPISIEESKGVVKLLWDIFGGTITDKGYKLLDSHIGCIYGDSINRERAIDICERLKQKWFASINWVAGIGSYTYQMNTRDTFGMAVKATYCEALSSDGKTHYEIPIFKDPITDDGTKKSARGLLAVFNINGVPTLKENASWSDVNNCMFEKVFENGVIVKEYSLAEIKNNLKKK